VSWWELVMPLLFAMFFLLLLIENMMQQSGVNPGTSG
jgi:hypothetical protein